MNRIKPVYENGILRPEEPLQLPEGQTVQLQIELCSDSFNLRSPTPAEEEYCRRLKECKSAQELLNAMNESPNPNDDYDLCEALNQNRRLAGLPLVYPDLTIPEKR